MTDRQHYAEMGKRIRAIRKARGLSQTHLGAAIARTDALIQATEQGRVYIDAPRLEAICAALGVTVKAIQSPHWRRLCSDGRISLEEAL